MKFLFSISLLFATGILFSQIQGNGGVPKGLKQKDLSKKIDHRTFAQPNIEELRAEDALVDNTGTAPWRFGFKNYTNLGLNNSGSWINIPNGDRIWLLKVSCEKALTVNLTFSNTTIPEGNELYVYNDSKDFILGKFNANHIYNGQLGTELIPGNTAIIEYYVKRGTDLGNVQISTVTHGYRTADEFQAKAFGGSGACNMNVNCPDGLPWQLERNSAVMLVSGSNGFCSGALINNTLNDGKPYVLTANHCYSDPTNWIFRFNWQSADCNNPAASPTFQSLSGAVLRSRRTPTDFCLVEITGGLQGNTVPLTYNPYFAGWNNADAPPTSSVCIHHPSGDIKKIAFDDAPAVSSQGMGSSEANSTWTVEWDRNTTTEGGSSGSPLFDQNHRIIGQLWGGGASCTNLSAPDYYGRLHKSWEPANSTSSNQLKFWLDPNNSGTEFIDGYDPSNATPVAVDPGVTNPQGVSGTFCGAEVTPQVTIQNNGSDALTTVDIVYGFDGNQDLVFNWIGNLAQWQSTAVSLPTATLTAGAHTFAAAVSNPNAGLTDENSNNNSVSSSFTIVIGGQSVQLNLVLDCYGSETTWELQNASSTAVYAGSGYPDDQPGLVTLDPWCLNDGCYTYYIMDSYGDGMDGGFWCQEDGSVSIVFDGEVLAEILESEADFGDQTSLQFCIGQSGIEWNTDELVSLWPNPISEGMINIQTGSEDVSVVSILTINGQRLSSKTSSSSLVQFDTNRLSQGTYLVEIVSGKERKVLKFIKTR
ncbi:MAG: T9SS type A sorting domain-containing protein [Bacteroidetes bacterium]|nr:T9SS type A sorting domain-containing protein [Bacteroidota bacterium]